MTLPAQIATHTVTIVRAGEPTGEDAYGNATGSSEQRIDVVGCSLQPVRGEASQETMTPSSDVVISRWILYAEADVVLLPSDRVQQARDRVSPVASDADAYLDLQVDGDSAEWIATGTDLDHVEVYLKRWEG